MTAATMSRRAIKSVGLLPGLATPRRRGDIVLLLYHRIGVEDGEIGLPARAFERQMRTLADDDRPLSLDRAIDGDDRGGVVVTVDDGYADFYENALPILVRTRVPAILYLATGLVRNNGGPADRLSWAQLAEAVATGLVTIGSHTHNHADLSRADEREAEVEMRRSKELIEDHLGTPCQHFAFPWAVASDAARRASASLFRSSALPAWRTNRRGRIDRQSLGRTPVLRSDGHVFFRAKVRGMLDGEAFFYRIARRGPWRQR